MTTEDLVDIFRSQPAEAVSRCGGLAAHFFFAQAFLNDAVRCSGGSPVDRTVGRDQSGSVVLEIVVPEEFRTPKPPDPQIISDPFWRDDLLSSFTVDGRPLDDVVRPLLGRRGEAGWILARRRGISVVVVASAELEPSIVKRMRGRRVEAIGTCATTKGDVALIGSPGIWRTTGGWLGALMHARDVDLNPREVFAVKLERVTAQTLLLEASDGEVPYAAKSRGANPPDVAEWGSIPAAVAAMVHALSPMIALDDAARVEALATALMSEQPVVWPRISDSEEITERVVREALHVLSLDDGVD